MMKFALTGTLNDFPQLMTVPLALIVPLFLAQIAIPSGLLWVERPFRKLATREVIGFLEGLKEGVLG